MNKEGINNNKKITIKLFKNIHKILKKNKKYYTFFDIYIYKNKLKEWKLFLNMSKNNL